MVDDRMGCGGRCDGGLPFSIAMAFQPIVDVVERTVWGHEALVRGPAGEPAGWVLGQVTEENRYAFDQACRVAAIEEASALGLDGRLSINFLPNAVYNPLTCISATLAAARRNGFDTRRLVFEVTEGERVTDHAHLRGIVEEYKRQGFVTAIDDFGSGYSGLNLLAEFQPDVLKLDMELTRNIDNDRARRAIVSGVLATCRDLDIVPVAEGVETDGEAATLAGLGVRLMQGYRFARPAFRALTRAADIAWPGTARDRADGDGA